MKFYEILLRGDASGNYQGGHLIETPGGDAKPITDAQWPDVVKGLNENLLATTEQRNAEVAALTEAKDAEVKALAGAAISELQTLKEKTAWALEQASGVIADSSVDDKATIAHISAVIAEVTKDDRQRAREALEASIKAQQEQLAALAAL